MNSTRIRYIAAAGYLVVAALAIFKVIDSTQATSLIAAGLASYHFAQGNMTPATNSRTPDNLPPKP